LSTPVLQGSVATRVNYGKIFKDLFIANLLLSVTVKEFWRSVRFGKVTAKNQVAPFFRTRCSNITNFGEDRHLGVLLVYAKELGVKNSEKKLKLNRVCYQIRDWWSNITW